MSRKVGTGSIDSASLLYNKYLCSEHFLESDYTATERTYLNHLAVPCGPDSALQSVLQHSAPSLHVPSLDSLPSALDTEDDLSVLLPTSTYEVLTESSRTVNVVTASVKEDERGGQDHTSASLLHHSAT
jgi:hypothetical protein